MATAENYTKYYWIKEGTIGIGYIDEDSEGDTNLNAVDEVKEITVHYGRKTSVFGTDLSVFSEIPPQFHEALVARVLDKLYARRAGILAEQGQVEVAQAMLALVRYWRGEWKNYLRRGSAFANKRKDGTAYAIKPHTY